MKVIRREEQQKIRRQTSETLTVFDQKTGEPIGEVLDMSAKGLKLVGKGPIASRRIYYCRMPLKKNIDGCEEVFFDAECRWCKKSDEAGKYNSGFLLRYSSPKDAAIVQKLIFSWMVNRTERMSIR